MQKIVVTGGARGIGKAVCEALAARGYNVAVNHSHVGSAEAARLGGGKSVIIGNPRTHKTPELLAAFAIGAVALLAAWVTRQPWWWRLIHAAFAPLAAAVATLADRA